MIKLCGTCNEVIEKHLNHDCVRNLMRNIHRLQQGIDILLKRDGCTYEWSDYVYKKYDQCKYCKLLKLRKDGEY